MKKDDHDLPERTCQQGRCVVTLFDALRAETGELIRIFVTILKKARSNR